MADGAGAPVIGSISFDATITSLFGPLASGQRVVLLPEGRELETLSSAALTGADHTFYKITPSHLDGLNALTDPATLAGRVRELVIGGEALTSASLEPWKTFAPDVVIANEYGPTETVVGCAIYRVAARIFRTVRFPSGARSRTRRYTCWMSGGGGWRSVRWARSTSAATAWRVDITSGQS